MHKHTYVLNQWVLTVTMMPEEGFVLSEPSMVHGMYLPTIRLLVCQTSFLARFLHFLKSKVLILYLDHDERAFVSEIDSAILFLWAYLHYKAHVSQILSMHTESRLCTHCAGGATALEGSQRTDGGPPASPGAPSGSGIHRAQTASDQSVSRLKSCARASFVGLISYNVEANRVGAGL